MQDEPVDSPESDVLPLLQTATRDLVGVALRSLQGLDDPVSLPQFRLLFALDDLGRTPSSRVAAALDLGPSSVTRLADRLGAAGYVVRGADPANRSVVTLELTARGRAVVRTVLARRRAELDRALARLTPRQRAALVESLGVLHEAISAEMPRSTGPSSPLAGPVPL